nr:hypothetical protein [Candidatus Sigynarchaeota archaeon]
MIKQTLLSNSRKNVILLVIGIVVSILSLSSFPWPASTRTTRTFDPPMLRASTVYNYTMIENATFHWIDVTNGTRDSVSDDSLFVRDLPFDNGFSLFGDGNDELRISTEGYALYDSINYGSVISIPTTSLPHSIMPFFSQMYVLSGSSGIFHASLSNPNRFVVEWKEVRADGTGNLIGTFEMVLYETGSIVFNYLSLDNVTTYSCGLNHGCDTSYYARSTSLGNGTKNYSIRFNPMEPLPSAIPDEDFESYSGSITWASSRWEGPRWYVERRWNNNQLRVEPSSRSAVYDMVDSPSAPGAYNISFKLGVIYISYSTTHLNVSIMGVGNGSIQLKFDMQYGRIYNRVNGTWNYSSWFMWGDNNHFTIAMLDNSTFKIVSDGRMSELLQVTSEFAGPLQNLEFTAGSGVNVYLDDIDVSWTIGPAPPLPDMNFISLMAMVGTAVGVTVFLIWFVSYHGKAANMSNPAYKSRPVKRKGNGKEIPIGKKQL